MKVLLADIEADNLLLDLTKIWCIALADEDGEPTVYADQPGYPSLEDALQRMAEADRVIFHNGLGYDYWAIERIYPGRLDFAKVIDTLVIRRFMNPDAAHSLEEIGKSLGVAKMAFDDFSKFSKEMAIYCAQDVRVLRHVWKQCKHVLARFREALMAEHRVAYVIAKQEQHGFRFDTAAAQALVLDLTNEKDEIEKQLQKVFPPITIERVSEKTGKTLKPLIEEFNPGSRVQIAQRLIDRYGWKPKELTGTGLPKVDETILESLPYPEAKLCGRYLRIGKLLGMLSEGDNAWLKLDRNGRIHGRVNTIGCRTHRMTHFKPNMAQVDSDHRCRALFLPDVGEVQVGCDAEGLELRMLAHFLYPYDRGEFSAIVVEGRKEDGTDVHSVNMRNALLYLRNSAKTLIYALIYGGGNLKVGSIVYEDAAEAGKPVRVPGRSMKEVGKNAREKLVSNITGFRKLVEKVAEAHNAKGWFTVLDGRVVKSKSEHSALNSILQAAGAVVMKYALIEFDIEIEKRLKAEWNNYRISYCANVHDEVQLSVSEPIAEEVGKLFAECITMAGIRLGIRVPLSGSYQIGRNWSETH